ncbi:MAG: MBL fold metallo-hydrolase [Deltaproteobacteria bacterium]|nr:MBL fold metallo-hydrolase [Deltaproteobacteria bacterium]
MTLSDFAKKISWLGHDGFRIESGITTYFDPFQIKTDVKADLILITHEHFDHCSPEDVEKIKGPDTVIITEKDSAKKLAGDISIMEPGDKLTIKNISVEAVRAYNIDKAFHPRKNNWLGFIVTIDGHRIYHAGDTDLIPEMSDINVDIALLPVSGTYVMTAAQAVEAAKIIMPELAIPMHFGSIVGDDEDARYFKEKLEGVVDVILPD